MQGNVILLNSALELTLALTELLLAGGGDSDHETPITP